MRTLSAEPVPKFDAVSVILGLVRQRTGLDFSTYRHQTIRRRLRNRMISVGLASVDDYLVLLRDSDAETLQLVDRLTVKVSRFYRNAAVFDQLRKLVLPRLQRRFGEPLRLWSVGCARGEEPYSLAILLEAAGIDGSVLATDIDRSALATAERGVYTLDAFEELPPALAAQALEPLPGDECSRRVRPAIRRRVHFDWHDITSPALPAGRRPFHLICYRNLLIYLQRDMQERTLRQLLGVLADGGCLCLGEAEWPPGRIDRGLVALPGRTRVFEALARRGEAANDAGTGS